MTLQKRKQAFVNLGHYLNSDDEALVQLIYSASQYNAWFTPAETLKAVRAAGRLLNSDDLDAWLGFGEEQVNVKKIGLVLAGNIPLVGFHDILSVLAVGHAAFIKLSSQDQRLIPHLLKKLTEFESAFSDKICFIERLDGYDAVIATGSNNSSRYFEYYFSQVPHIIRKNRNSVAVLAGNEATADLLKLGYDIFDYFGLGCRNISKIYVPKGYDFTGFFESIEVFKTVSNHHKYNNNYDYNKSIYLVNCEAHLDNGFLLVKADERLASPLAVLFYQEYASVAEVELQLNGLAENVQCIVSNMALNVPTQRVAFGQSQHPKLWDYADGVNTLAFLQAL